MGKSSLLYQITWPQVRERHLSGSGGLRVVFLDFQQLRDLSVPAFFSLLASQIHKACPELGETEAAGHRSFQQIVETLTARRQSLVLLFDEFDAVTSNAAFDKEFYSFLRSMANHYAVAYVTSSRNELQRLCHSSAVADSPFFNIFSNLYLRPFERDEARELISVPSAAAGCPLSDFADEIVDLVGLFPFYLQIACSVFVDWLCENPGRAPERAQIGARVLEEAAPHYDYLLEHSSPEQVEVFRVLSKGLQPQREALFVCQKLVRDGYLEADNQQYRICSRLFAEHVLASTSWGGDRQSAASASGPLAENRWMPGRRIGSYEILALIGEGGMGRVYRARDHSLQRTAAVKVIKPELLSSETLRRRFLQEARLVASVSHPAVTSVYQLLELGNEVALVMEWLDGKTLKQIIAEQGPLNWKQVVQWLILACGGLEAAHRQGVVHRDIKSANLMVIAGGLVKILDFGLARHDIGGAPAPWSSDLTSQGALLGTVDYMSPEQACGQTVDIRSDLFSLGVVFFEALTGALPFRRNSVPATLHAIVNEPAPDLGLFEVEGADRVDPVLRKLLEKQPARRYPGPVQLEKDLKDLLKPGRRLLRWFRED
jgi:serine/threonine-protein kinase